jgi:hypothetical protein
MGGDNGANQRLVPRQRGAHRRSMQFPERAGSFDVGAQEGDNALRKLGTTRASAGRPAGLSTHLPTPKW